MDLTSDPGTASNQEPPPRSRSGSDGTSRPGQRDGPAERSAELEAFEAFTHGMLATTRSLGKDLNRHAPTYMGGFGALIITAVLAMQAYPADFDLSSSEFIAVVTAGLAMVCLGAALIAFRYRTFERTEAAAGEQAKDILVGDAIVPGASLLRKPQDEPAAEPNGRRTDDDEASRAS